MLSESGKAYTLFNISPKAINLWNSYFPHNFSFTKNPTGIETKKNKSV